MRSRLHHVEMFEQRSLKVFCMNEIQNEVNLYGIYTDLINDEEIVSHYRLKYFIHRSGYWNHLLYSFTKLQSNKASFRYLVLL